MFSCLGAYCSEGRGNTNFGDLRNVSVVAGGPAKRKGCWLDTLSAIGLLVGAILTNSPRTAMVLGIVGAIQLAPLIDVVRTALMIRRKGNSDGVNFIMVEPCCGGVKDAGSRV